MFQVRSIGNGLHPVGLLTPANLALNPSMEVANPNQTFSEVTPSTTYTRTNMCINPSFEVDETGWSTTGAATIVSDPSVFYKGIRSGKLSTTAVGQQLFLNPQPVGLPNTSYTASAYVEGSGSVTIQLVSLPEGTAFATSASISLTSDWQRISVTGISPSDATNVYVSITQTTSGNNTVWVDNVLLEQTSELRDYFDGDLDLTIFRRNLCTNPNFETTANWTPGGTVAPTITSSTDRKIFGKQSLKISWFNSTARDSTVTYNHHTTEIGQQYAYSVYVYVPSGNSPVVLSAGGMSAASTVVDDWQRLSIVFIATVTSHPFVITESQSTSGVAYLDGVLIEQSGALGDYFDSTLPPFPDGKTQELALDGTNESVQYIPNSVLSWSSTPHASASVRSDVGVAHWTATNANVNRVADRQYGQTFCAKMMPTSLSLPPKMEQNFTVIDSTNYSINFRLQIPSAITGGGVSVGFSCFDGTNTLIQIDTVPLLITSGATAGFIRLATTYLVPAGTATLTVSIEFASQPTSLDDTMYVDAFMFEQADTPSANYVDGSYAGYVWAGTEGESVTLQTALPTTLSFFATTIPEVPNDQDSDLPFRANAVLHESPWSPLPLTD